MPLLVSAAPDCAFDRQPLTLSPDTCLRSAIAQMHDRNCACALIVEADRLSGWVWESDVVRWIASRTDLDAVAVIDAMSVPIVTLTPDAVIDLRQQGGLRAVPIVESGDRLLGLLHLDRLLAIESARVQTSEAQLRRVVDSNMIGIYFARRSGEILDANDAFLATVGYSRSDLQAGRLNWQTITPPEHQATSQQIARELQRDRVSATHEKAYFRQDGSRVSVLLSVALIEAAAVPAVTFVLDISSRKQMEEHLKAALHEKERLLKELHHRIKNDLQIISSIFSLQSQSLDDPIVRSLLSASQNRIRSIALIYEKLDQCVSTCVDFADYAQTLAYDLFAAYTVCPDAVQLTLDLAPALLDLDTALSCGLVLNELVSNVLKHAFPQPRSGKLIIRSTVENQRFMLVVQDDGVGLPPDFELRQSLGLRLVQALARQLRGELQVDSEAGTTVQITLPLQTERFRA